MQTVWNTWSARGWPLSLPEEAAFVRQLASGLSSESVRLRGSADALAQISRLVDAPVAAFEKKRSAGAFLSESERDQVVWLVTVMRCGASLQHAQVLAPGIDPKALFAAYVSVEQRRRAAVAAWRRLCRTPTPRTFLETAQLAALVLPSALAKVAAAAERSPADLAAAVTWCDVTARETSRKAHTIEAVLAAGRSPDPTATGRALLDPTNPGWWDHAMYLPRRVGDLSPNRLRDLLGEERQ